MNAKKSFTKEEEKKILTALVTGDSYFGNTFDSDDLAIMCHNIDMDFSLMMNSGFDKKIREAETKLGSLEIRIMDTDSVLSDTRVKLIETEMELEKVRTAKAELLTTLLEILHTGDLDSGVQCSIESEIYRNYSGFEIIRAKMKCRMPINERDFKFVEKLEKAA